MDKNYYAVYIDDNGRQKEEAVICKCLGRVNTIRYGSAPIFREIITDAIIRPKYDTIIEDEREDLNSLVYDNVNVHSYSKMQDKKVLAILINFTEHSIEKYLKTINELETKQVKKVLNRVRKEDICNM